MIANATTVMHPTHVKPAMTPAVKPAVSNGGGGAGLGTSTPANNPTPTASPAPQTPPAIPSCIPPSQHAAYLKLHANPSFDRALAARTPLYQAIFQASHVLADSAKIADTLGLTPAELLEIRESQPYQDFAIRYQAILDQHLHLHAAMASQQAIDALRKLTNSDKPEVARRAANTILTLAGLLPPKSPSPKPWESTMKPATSGGAGPETPTPAKSPIPTAPTPSNNSEFSIHHSALPSSLTKQHPPTYNNSADRPQPGTPAYREFIQQLCRDTTLEGHGV